MANYSLVVDSKFQPFSFERYIQPYQIYGQAYKEVEDALGGLDAKASIWENMANEQTDPIAYKMYKTYADDLKAQAELLAREGLNVASRRNMLNMRSRYNKEIVPIEQAYAARAREAEEQNAGKAKGMVYEGDASVASLDRYIKNPTIKYKFANSQESFARVASAANALQKELRSYGKGKSLDPYTNTFLQEHGYKSTEVNQAIAEIQAALNGDGNIRGNSILSSLLANEMQVSGVANWDSNSAKQDFFSRIAPALYGSVGQTSVNTMENYGARLAAQERSRRAAGAESGTSTPPALRRGLPIDLHHILTGREDVLKRRAENAMRKLGINPKSKKFARTVQYINSSGLAMPSIMGGGTIPTETGNLKIFSNDGRMLTRYQIVSQGKNKHERDIIARFYDNEIVPAVKDLGYDLGSLNKEGKTVKANNLIWGYNNINSETGPRSMAVLSMRFNDSNKVLEDVLPTLTDGDNTVIREVSDYSNSGGMKFSDRTVPSSTFTDSDGKLKGKPSFFASPNPNNKGIIMKFNGKTYFIPGNKLGSISDEAYGYDVPRLTELNNIRESLINKYGEDAYYGSKTGGEIEDAIENYGGAYLREMYNALGWSAHAPVYDVHIK